MKKLFGNQKVITGIVLIFVMVGLIAFMGVLKARSSESGEDGWGYYMPWGYYANGYAYWNPSPVGGTHSNGTLIKGTTGDEIYILQDADKRHIKSPTVFSCNGFAWGNVVTVSNTEKNGYATVSDLLCPSGTLIKTTAAPVYVINEDVYGNYTKRHITSLEVFAAAGFNWNSVYVVSDTERDYYTTGTDFDETATVRPNGSLLKVPYLPQVWVLDSGQKKWVVSPTAFVSNGFSWSNVITVNLWDLNVYATGNPVRAARGTLLKSTGPEVYVTDLVGGLYYGNTYYRRHITSPSVFTSKGYIWANVYTVDAAELNTYADALPIT